MKDFNLKFLNSVNNNCISFLPFGVTSIEFTIEGKFKAGHIRPVNSTLKYPEKKEFVGFAENNEDFLVVWGGGEEPGQKVDANSANRMFVQLIHLKGNHATASIKFEHTAYGQKKTLEICKPPLSPDIKEVFRMEICKPEVAPGMNEVFLKLVKQESPKLKTSCLVGTYLPMYYSRWFPPKQISYYKPQSFPQISLYYVEDESGIEAPVEIFSKVKGQNKKIGIIEGDLRYSHIHAELFTLLEKGSKFVLRVWFYWIHKRYREGLLGDDDFSSISEENSLGGGYDKLTRLEIPDIERFDFVINAEENRVIMYGTDIHYQEYWGKIKSPIAEAKIAGVSDVVPVTAVLFPLRFIQRASYHNPIDSVKEAILKDMKSQKWMKMSVGKEAPDIIDESKCLALGDIRAHVPYIGFLWNRGGKEFISSDSRKGAQHG